MRTADDLPATAASSFAEIQRQFTADNPTLSGLLPGPGTMIVLPSLSLPVDDLAGLKGMQHYEERLLFLLLALGRPGVRIVYLSSLPIDDAVVDYYLRLLPDPGEARSRLTMVAAGDAGARPLTAKLLERPELLRRLRPPALDADNPWILPFNVTTLETAFARRLGTPIYGPDPGLARLGSKSGSRRVARSAGVPVPDGFEDLRSLEELEEAATRLRRRHGSEGLIVKLNDSFSGLGNATVAPVASSLMASPTSFSAAGETWPGFAAKIACRGAVVEQLLRRPQMTFPSVLAEISPGGDVSVLATHDQVLGGPNGQIYVGCRFPAAAGYRDAVRDSAEQVAKTLAAAGVVGIFGIDFMVVPSDGHRVFLGEINLRLGGTTHPFGVALLATGGRPRSYVATDNHVSPRLAGMRPGEVIGLLDRGGLAFRPGARSGVILHLLGAAQRFGKVGFTCIASSPEEATSLYRRTVAAIDGSTT
jgi:hypothetical protein